MINLVNLQSLIFISMYLYIINAFLNTTNLRKKFFLFIINLFLIVSIGLFYGLDGLILLFLVSELSVVLIFITMFSQLYAHHKQDRKNKQNIIVILLLLAVNTSYYEVNLLSFNSFYSFYSVSINDFYYIYNCYFEKQILLTVFTIFIITIYSIFFILLYYSLKQKTATESMKTKNIIILRKQNMLHQANYHTKIRIFKNKI